VSVFSLLILIGSWSVFSLKKHSAVASTSRFEAGIFFGDVLTRRGLFFENLLHVADFAPHPRPLFRRFLDHAQSGSLVASPAFSFALPFASLKTPLILSFVLDFIRTKSRAINSAVVMRLKLKAIAKTKKQKWREGGSRLSSPSSILSFVVGYRRVEVAASKLRPARISFVKQCCALHPTNDV
jgi:hypothetical protein